MGGTTGPLPSLCTLGRVWEADVCRTHIISPSAVGRGAHPLCLATFFARLISITRVGLFDITVE